MNLGILAVICSYCYAPLLVDLPILLENIHFRKKVLKYNSDKEGAFLSLVNMGLYALNFLDLDSLSEAVSRVFTNTWEANARSITVTIQSKE